MKESVILKFLRWQMEENIITVEYKKNLNRVSDAYDKLVEKLSVETITLLEKFVEAVDIMSVQDVEYFFTQGFKLGLQVAFEAVF